ncbi:hypothetical protein Peur_049425 [Populus x canadensis]|jgi:hypothetical protein|uniref:Uncharacterized protein n=1 Tax=Populus trichocarpa TaxID=3694 RepID=A0A2K2AB93_POPTR
MIPAAKQKSSFYSTSKRVHKQATIATGGASTSLGGQKKTRLVEPPQALDLPRTPAKNTAGFCSFQPIPFISKTRTHNIPSSQP